MSKSLTSQKNEKKDAKATKENELEIKDSKKKRKKSIIVEESREPSPEVCKPIPQHIFLYMHLNRIENLPNRDNDLILRIEHAKNTVSKLEDHYTTNTDINLSDENATIPTFSIRIDQDSMEDINMFSDNPLMMTLYEHIVPIIDEEEEEEEQAEVVDHQPVVGDGLPEVAEGEGLPEVPQEQWIALAQGHIDLLQFFSHRRNFHTVNVFVYPIARDNDFALLRTVKLTWQIYSILPLIKELTVSNMVFITLESIYNAKPELTDGDLDFVVDLWFQSKIPNENQELEKVKICSYTCFTKEIIANQNSNQMWENAKNNQSNNINSLGIQFGCKLRIYKLLENLLCTEGVEFRLDEISIEDDYALVCNSVHRYVLNCQLSAILEDVVAFNQQHILLELYRRDQPDVILLQGTADLSIFVYPRVNVCRFGIELRPPPAPKSKQEEAKPTTSKPPPKSSKTKSLNKSITGTSLVGSVRPSEKVTFAIVNICMLTPLTERMDSMSNHESPVKKDKLRLCTKLATDSGLSARPDILEETYKAYDELIMYLIEYIVEKNIKTASDAKNFLCCQLGNKTNKMVKLIAYDFNKRFPTKNNIEFTKLLTTVYKELMQRQYSILQKCIHPSQEKFVIPGSDTPESLIYTMNMTKYMFEAGNPTMGNYLFDKIKSKNPHSVPLSFYIFLYDMEKLDYESAKKYLEKPLIEREIEGEYFANIIQLYIGYMESLQAEQIDNDPYEELLKNVKSNADRYPKQLEFWVLLYCLYKKSRYLPGMSFARWRYENLYRRPFKQLPSIPKSRWQLYNDGKLSVKSSKGIHFYQVLDLFLRLGVYKFAEFVYNEIAPECTEPEKYFMVSTFKILQNELEKKYSARLFATEKMLNGDAIKALQYQVNGNLDFYRDDFDAAMRNYSKIIEIPSLSDFDSYQLGLLRYGYYMAEQQSYEQSIRAFERCCTVNGNSFIAYISIGRSMYKLGRLEDAENFFAESTKYEIHIPDVWAYLALINLKLGNNFKALEFWKYAKLNPDNVISEEILDELRTINYSDVNLYIDKP